MKLPLQFEMILCLWLIIALVSGCSSGGMTGTDVHGVLPSPPSESLRSEVGTVSVFSTLALPNIQFISSPAIGGWDGFLRGAVFGSYFGGCWLIANELKSQAPTADPRGWALALALCLGGGTVGGVSVGMYGAFAAEPAKNVEAVMTTVRNTLMSSDLHRNVRNQVEARMPIDTQFSQPASAERVATTRLEIEVASIVLDGLPSSAYTASEFYLGLNPSVRLVVTAQARLVRNRDQGEIYLARFQHWGPTMTVAEWARNDAEFLRNEIDHATLALAEQIVDTIFFLYRYP